MDFDMPKLLTTSNKVKESFNFLQEYNYKLLEYKKISNEEYQIVYDNKGINKNINISICNYEDVKRFFMTISIIREPYLDVNDFISFEVFLTKQNIKHTTALEGDQINNANLSLYVEEYANLFKRYGIELINTNERFPHYFPEWT